MKRLTCDLLVAATLAVAPLAFAQGTGDERNPVNNPSDTRTTVPPGTTAPSPSSPTRRNTPPYPGDEPTAPGTAPSTGTPAPGVPSPAMPSPSPSTDTTRSGQTGGSDMQRASGESATAAGDLGLVQKIHELNVKEMDLAQLATEKATSSKVKSYAKKLVSEHKSADRQLLSWAEKKGMNRSQIEQVSTAAAGSTTPEHDMKARLQGENGREFDQDFVSTMIDDHDRAIETVRSARDSAQDPQLRALLEGMLPKLEKHRKAAQELMDKQSKT